MKRILLFISIVLLIVVSGCEKRVCRCESLGTVQEVSIVPGEECSDLEPMMGECTEI
jgi:hypothetical protein